ncbi:hypothetical protein [uncultured Muribaculum sp.]|nr:hypothetical protein [uncultured Muribaculum sp.]
MEQNKEQQQSEVLIARNNETGQVGAQSWDRIPTAPRKWRM